MNNWQRLHAAIYVTLWLLLAITLTVGPLYIALHFVLKFW